MGRKLEDAYRTQMSEILQVVEIRLGCIKRQLESFKVSKQEKSPAQICISERIEDICHCSI